MFEVRYWFYVFASCVAFIWCKYPHIVVGYQIESIIKYALRRPHDKDCHVVCICMINWYVSGQATLSALRFPDLCWHLPAINSHSSWRDQCFLWRDQCFLWTDLHWRVSIS